MALFVGRERELAQIDRAVEEAALGLGGLLLVSGEAGIGKTRIAEEAGRRADARGFAVAWGRSWEAPGTPAYYPWMQALRALERTFRTVVDEARGESSALAPLLGTGKGAPASPALPASPERTSAESPDPAEARFRMFEAVVDLLARAAEERPILLVLDDLHAADRSTLDLLHFVARHVRGARVLVLATSRDVTSEGAGAAIAGLGRDATAVPLGRLVRDDLAAWIGDAAPELGASIDRVLSVSEGNPLFVGELIASATKRPGRSWSAAHELPIGIREAIRAHLAVLSPEAREVLAIASVLGREIARAALDALLVRTHEGAFTPDALAEAARAEILVDSDLGGLRFTHVLMRDELYAGLEPERRAEIHRAVAVDERDPVVAAAHWLAGSRTADLSRLLEAVHDAMGDAHARFAFEDAALLGQRALDLGVLPLREQCALRIAVGEAWALAGRAREARDAGALAAEEARRLPDGELLARAALVHATEIAVGDRDEPAVRLLRDALATFDDLDSSLRAQVMARLAIALLPAPPEEHDGALRLAEDAIAMARRLGDDDTLFAVLRFTRSTPSETDDARTRFALTEETLALARKLGRVAQVASLFAWQVAACLELGDLARAVREVEVMELSLSAYRQPAYRYRPLLVRAMLADLEGRFAEADALSREARALTEEHGIFTGMMLFATQRMGFLHTRGDVDGWAEMEPVVIRILGQGPTFALFRCMFDAACGRADRVRESLALIGDAPLRSLPDGSALGWACAAAGIVERAEAFYDAVLVDEAKGPWQFGPGRVTSVGPRALILGRLALLLGRTDVAIDHLERALAFVEKIRSRPFVAQTHLELAGALASRDVARARAHAQTAHDIAHDVGMRGVKERAANLVASLQPNALPSSILPTPTPTLSLAREGEMWRIAALGRSVSLRDSKGLAYLDALVRAPCREIHVVELVGAHDEGDAGPVLDERAKQAYRERAASLREELDEATGHGDLGRAERARAELDALATELSKAVGLGGRDRRAVSPTERARINVQRRLRDVIGRVRAADEVLGLHLERSVRTGVFCVYLPTWGEK